MGVRFKILFVILFIKCTVGFRPFCFTDDAPDFELQDIFDETNSIMAMFGRLAERNLTQSFEEYEENEDINLNITQLVWKYAKTKLERYEVDSQGYRLALFRWRGEGEPVLLMHGLYCSADDFVSPGPGRGIAYLLAEQGYDVWLGNARGNKHSRSHVSMSPDSHEFWDFSWDEIGRHDIPAFVDFVLNATGRPQLKYLGHSQGTTAFYCMAAERPDYNDKVAVAVHMAPCAWMSHIASPLIRMITKEMDAGNAIFELIGQSEFLPATGFVRKLSDAACRISATADLICNQIMFILCGFDPDETDYRMLPALYAHFPGGASSKQFFHYVQVYRSGHFRKFDYGPARNLQLYGQPEPPMYAVERITAPIVILSSHGDWMSAIQDVRILRRKLPNVAEYYVLPQLTFDHMDYLFSKNLKTITFPVILRNLQRFNITQN